MSLHVDVYFRESDGGMRLVESAPGEDLAGFESYRKSVYGSDVARSLGLSLFCNLATEDLYAEGELVSQLIAETSIALDNVALLARAAGSDQGVLYQRLENILNAAKKAENLGAGVVVW